ncbi:MULTISPECIES: proline--tRNA ligase [Terrabacteria group]|uniref:proline--tRNA ligase n=1 Tax=Bacillati TaxID=1783272 RepID=UPI00193A4C01|nr:MULTISPECIES: proline--tRNA ligase [Terrabacteria group]MBW9211800.1 proline--tRNA ligase [Trueperella sp. zg.1013]QRG87395.1 proline--tRNA ligase [Bulleidia sp. zg-1006]
MRLKNSYFFTLRENAKDEDSQSSNLLVRAGMIRKSSTGVYMILPMGLKVFNKIKEIIREEMAAIGCQELLMPALIPEEVYIASGRRDGFGSSMFSLKDRKKQNYVLGPTHEELFAHAAKLKIRSYKDMPFSIYQIQTKFRDEPRPRYGLIRVREFQMKDAYSFDVDEASMDISYNKQFQAYKNIFNRLGLNYVIVKANTGVMGGLLSEEFQALSPIGEDILALNEDGSYAANLEVAACLPEDFNSSEEKKSIEKVETLGQHSIEEVVHFLKIDAKRTVKTLCYEADGELVVVLVRGDREVNETKVQMALGCLSLELAPEDKVKQLFHCPVGSLGPIGLKAKILADQEVELLRNFVLGANEDGYHYIHVNPSDFEVSKYGDFRQLQEGDACPMGQGNIHFEKGIEVGNTFKLGTKYSKAMDLQYLNANNQLDYVWMGCYGIGPARVMAALAEQNLDENGINWPKNLAPYRCSITIISMKSTRQVQVANELYETLRKAGIDVLLDDRDERPGVKFKDMDLIGIPTQITVGKAIVDGQVEMKERGCEKQLIAISSVLDYFKD